METERRNPMRVIAPVALVLFALALLLVVVTSGGGGSDEKAGGKSAEKARDLGSAPQKKPAKKRNADKLPEGVYVVKSGDTLGSISEKTGVPVDELQEMNPELDPQALVSGQKIKLRE